MDTELAATWVRRWDAQQERYIADREERFAVIADVVAHTLAGSPGTVLDLGCGPGSLAARLAVRLPGSRIVGVDSDPLLLALGRARYGDAVEFVDADLTRDWSARIPDRLDAAVSTTALHWLDPEPLADVYRVLAERLRPGGVFVDGDHFTHEDPLVTDLLTEIRHARAARAGVTDHEDWTAWWTAVGEDPALAALVAERSERATSRHGGSMLPVAEHERLLRKAGFASTGTVWQTGDDFVLAAIR